MDDEQLLDFLLKEPVTVVKVEKSATILHENDNVLTAEQIKKRSTHERTRNERRDKLKVKRREEMKDLIDGLDDLILEDNGRVETVARQIIPKSHIRKEKTRERRKDKLQESHTNNSNIDVIDQLRKEMYHKKKPERGEVSTEDAKLDRLQRLNKKLERKMGVIKQNNDKNNDGKGNEIKTKEKRHRSRKSKVESSDKPQSKETHPKEEHSEIKPKKRERKHKSKKQIDESETSTPKIATSDALLPESHDTKENNDLNSKQKKNRQRHKKKKDTVSTNDTSKPVTNKSRKRYENKIKFLPKTTDSQLFSIEY